MASKCAEDGFNHCHKCGVEAGKDLRVTPMRSNPLAHWAICPTCHEAEGGVWWARVENIPKYQRMK